MLELRIVRLPVRVELAGGRARVHADLAVAKEAEERGGRELGPERVRLDVPVLVVERGAAPEARAHDADRQGVRGHLGLDLLGVLNKDNKICMNPNERQFF